ncbi:unnamed protein product [Symbiodinium microadriaticum]|nr:unnamed protein product [Symbiodinium microadriaticum]
MERHGPRLQEDAVFSLDLGLFRLVPNSFEASLWEATWELHELGCHCEAKVYDFLDFLEWCKCTGTPWLLRLVCHWTSVCQGTLKTMLSCSFLALLSLLIWPVFPAGRCRRSMRPANGPGKLCLAFVMLTVSRGAAATPDAKTLVEGGSVPMPDDLELWMAGQRTLREQLEDSISRWIWEQPLHHNSGTAPEPCYEVTPAHNAVVPAQPAMEDNTLHVTIWLGAAYYEAETIDMELPVPLSMRYMIQALKGACAVIPDSFDDLCPTVPQLGAYYGSFIAQPPWLRHTDRQALALDTRAVGGTAFVFYLEGHVNVAGIMQQMPEYMVHEIDIYVFGATDPLLRGQSLPPIRGGVIKIVPSGRPCHWEDNIEQRLHQPGRWNPHVDPPTHIGGLHTVFQSESDQVIEEILDDGMEPLEVAAENALEIDHGDVVTYLPEQRIPRLAHGGRMIYEQAAVLMAEMHNAANACIVYMDLRQLTFFPQWCQVSTQSFDPRAYIRDLQIPDEDDWVLTVEGGEPLDGGLLRVQHRETLTFWLQPNTSSSEDGLHGDDDGGDSSGGSDSDDDDTDSILRSSDVSGPAFPINPGDPPRGPPPARPMSRSRSPRRGTDQRSNGTNATIALIDHVGPPCYDMTQTCVAFPHSPGNVLQLLESWPCDWACPELDMDMFPAVTREALSNLVPWSQLWGNITAEQGPELHIYTDGSWMEKLQVGGCAVALLLCLGQSTALLGVLGSQTQGDSSSPWTFEAPPALKNEQVGIATGLLWLLQGCQFLRFQEIFFHFDCFSAGWPVEGQWSPVNAFSRQMRALEQFLCRLTMQPLRFRHSKAHVGNPFNEMVDVLAKMIARGKLVFPAPPNSVCELIQSTDLSWLPVMSELALHGICTGSGLRWDGSCPYGNSQLTPEQLIPTRGGDDQPSRELEIKILSLNAQSLRGKWRYYEDQLDAGAYNVACFQEAKSKSGSCSSKNFLRLSTDSDSHWGVAIWFSKQRGLLSSNGQPCRIGEEDINVLHKSPRLLVVSVSLLGQQFLVVSGHCPHSTKPLEAKEFFQTLRQCLLPNKEAAAIIVGLDLNGRLPTGAEGATGDLQHGDPDANGWSLLALAKEMNIWFPATYCDFHIGDTTTYSQANGATHRTDFIGVGGLAEVLEVQSRVVDEFDTANPNEDHSPASLDLTCRIDSHGGRPEIYRPRYDVDKMLTTEGRQLIAQQLQHYAPPSWTMHPDDHCQHLQDFLHSLMAEHFSKTEQAPRATYIPDDVWAWRNAKLRLKQKARHRKHLWQAMLSRAFLQWKEGSDYEVEHLLQKQALLYDVIAGAIRWITAKIKTGIQKAKACYLQQLVYQAGDKATDILHKAKAAGIGGRQARPVSRPLPALKDQEGQVAASRDDRDQIWLRHFGKQEMGEIIPTTRLLNEDQGLFWDEDLEWDIRDLPTLHDLEDVLRRAPRRKALGLDAIPGELLAASPAAMGRALYPLVFKSAAMLYQPVQWRGGILQESWKRAGDASSPTSYRSLFISSQVGKCYHKLLRRKAAPYVEQALHDFHLGAKQGAPVLYPALYIQAFLRMARRRHHSVAVLFLDVQSAYYRVIRELSVGRVDCDETIMHVFRYFDLAPDDAHEFLEVIKQGGMMKDAGLSGPLRHMAKDLLHRSWFITRHGTASQVCKTQAGSRPGESWADVIFSFVLSKILMQITEIATAEELLTELSVDLSTGLFGDPGSGEPTLARDSTWADDCAVPLSDEQPARLLRKASRMASIILDYCMRHGMLPNLKPKKTAFILAARGPGSQKARQRFFPKGEKVMALQDLQLEVTVASQYVHLGGLIDVEMKLQAEARRRLSMAKAAFDSGKALLYTNATIPLKDRAALFNTSITSTFFNLALWTTQTHAWVQLDGGFSRLLRGLLSKTYKGDMLYKVAAPAVHILTGVPPLECLLTKARLSLLCSMAKTAPRNLWAVLQEEHTWLSEVRADLEWLALDGHEWPPRQEAYWPEWRRILAESTAWFKRRVTRWTKATMQRCQKQHRYELGLWALARRAHSRQTTMATDRVSWTCRLCDVHLKTKAALGAHFFKVHKRSAKYRAMVTGSHCKACGRECWTRNRLAIHLRGRPSCVLALHRLGIRADRLAPGLGSRGWRQRAEEDYTLAVSARVDEPLPEVDGSLWDRYMEQAYAELCDELLVYDLPEAFDQLVRRIQTVFCRFPLYQQEMDEIAMHIGLEVRELREAGVADYWTPTCFDNLCAALDDFAQQTWANDDGQPRTVEPAMETLRQFQGTVARIQWATLLPTPEGENVTPDVCLRLADDWEVALSSDSRLADVATVESSYWLLLPDSLREAWEAALTGATVQLEMERVFALLVILMAIGVFSSFITSITATMSSLRKARDDSNKTQMTLFRFFNQRNLSVGLYGKVEEALRLDGLASVRVKESEVPVLARMPERLRMQLHEEMYMSMVNVLGFWPDSAPDHQYFYSNLCHTCISEEVCTQQQDVFMPGTDCKHVLVIETGLMHYFARNQANVLTRNQEVQSEDVLCLPCLWADWQHRGRLTAGTGTSYYGKVNADEFALLARKFGGAFWVHLQIFGILLISEIENRDERSSINEHITDIQMSKDELQRMKSRAETYVAILQANDTGFSGGAESTPSLHSRIPLPVTASRSGVDSGRNSFRESLEERRMSRSYDSHIGTEHAKYMRQFEKFQLADLDSYFEEAYAWYFIHVDAEDLRNRWSTVRPRVANILRAAKKVSRLPTISTWEIRRIDECLEKDIWYLRLLAKLLRGAEALGSSTSA